MPSSTHPNFKYAYAPYYACIAFIGLVGLSVAGYDAHRSYQLYQHGTVTRGLVDTTYIIEGGVREYKVSFLASDGQRYHIANHVGSFYDNQYQQGESVPVIYLPDTPVDGRIDNRWEQYGIVLGGLLMLGTAAAFAGVLYFKLHRPLLRQRTGA